MSSLSVTVSGCVTESACVHAGERADRRCGGTAGAPAHLRTPRSRPNCTRSAELLGADACTRNRVHRYNDVPDAKSRAGRPSMQLGSAREMGRSAVCEWARALVLLFPLLHTAPQTRSGHHLPFSIFRSQLSLLASRPPTLNPRLAECHRRLSASPEHRLRSAPDHLAPLDSCAALKGPSLPGRPRRLVARPSSVKKI